MIKKSIVAAGLVALAFAALPAFASASHPNPYLATNGEPVNESTKFTVGTDPLAEGGPDYHPRLETEGGNWVECETLSGEGTFENAETGWIKLKFEGNCHTKLNLACGTGEPTTHTIETTKLYFHLKSVETGVNEYKPGVLITPGEGETPHGTHFATFRCQLVGAVEVGGTSEQAPYAGIVGTITAPEESKEGDEHPSNTATLSFKQTGGVQEHRTVTNDSGETVEYDLKSSIGGGATETSAETAAGTITFEEGVEPEIWTTGE
jgi:hypothetical protein